MIVTAIVLWNNKKDILVSWTLTPFIKMDRKDITTNSKTPNSWIIKSHTLSIVTITIIRLTIKITITI